jgi:superfamily II DNA or RNA helicase
MRDIALLIFDECHHARKDQVLLQVEQRREVKRGEYQRRAVGGERSGVSSKR